MIDRNAPLVKPFLEAHELAIELRKLLDRDRHEYMEVPRAMMEQLCMQTSFMAGICIASLRSRDDTKPATTDEPENTA